MSSIDVPPEGHPKQTVTEDIVEGQVDTTDTKMRYLAYVNRFRTIALASSRYLAYTSGIPSLRLQLTFRRRRSFPKCLKTMGCAGRIWNLLGLCPHGRRLRSLQSQIPQQRAHSRSRQSKYQTSPVPESRIHGPPRLHNPQSRQVQREIRLWEECQ